MSEIYCIAIAVIIVGYVYLMISVITAPQKLFPILQLITLIGISSLFSLCHSRAKACGRVSLNY